MSPSLATFLYEAVNFLLLVGVLGWLLFRPVRRALDAERDRHAKQLEEGLRMRQEAETLVEQARASHEAAERDLAKERTGILAEAKLEAAKIAEDARATVASERRAFELELAMRREAEASAVSETVGRIAGGSVERLLAALSGPPLDVALVRGACEALRPLTSHPLGSVLVEAAHPLDDEAHKLLAGVLGKGIEVRIVPELGAGVRITTPVGQVDATARSLAREAARAMTSAAAPVKEEGPRAGGDRAGAGAGHDRSRPPGSAVP